MTAARLLESGELVEVPLAVPLPTVAVEARWNGTRERKEQQKLIQLAGAGSDVDGRSYRRP